MIIIKDNNFIQIFFKILKKIFRSRRGDVSLKVFTKIFFCLIFKNLFSLLKPKELIPNSCLIIFPPSLGIGDLIMLSRILDITRASKKYDLIKFTSTAPYLQKNIYEETFISIYESEEILRFETFIFPSPSFINIIFSLVLGKNKCKGYLYSNIVNFETKKPYIINFQEPYHRRLIPFNYLFNTCLETSPIVWESAERDKLKQRKGFLNINKFKFRTTSRVQEYFIVLSTYNFYEKFRPTSKSILKELKAIYKKEVNLIILGAKSKKEIIYNKNLESFLRKYLKNINLVNLTGLLNINNSLEIISQSNEYIGANNGLANVAQMLGVKCTLIFNGPENYKKRKFSKKAKFVTLN